MHLLVNTFCQQVCLIAANACARLICLLFSRCIVLHAREVACRVPVDSVSGVVHGLGAAERGCRPRHNSLRARRLMSSHTRTHTRMLARTDAYTCVLTHTRCDRNARHFLSSGFGFFGCSAVVLVITLSMRACVRSV